MHANQHIEVLTKDSPRLNSWRVWPLSYVVATSLRFFKWSSRTYPNETYTNQSTCLPKIMPSLARRLNIATSFDNPFVSLASVTGLQYTSDIDEMRTSIEKCTKSCAAPPYLPLVSGSQQVHAASFRWEGAQTGS